MMRTFYVLAFIAIAVSSCAKRIDAPEGVGSLRLTVTRSDFSELNGSVVTRATESKFQNGDAIGVFIHTAASVGSSGNHSTNMKYITTDAGGSWQAVSQISDGLSTGTTYYSTGYYPYTQSGSDGTNIVHSVQGDQSISAADRATNLELSDFMITSPCAVSVKSNALATTTLGFKHILTKLIVNVNVPTEIDNIKTAAVKSVVVKGLNSTCNINIATGGVTQRMGTAMNITPRLLLGTGVAGAVSSWEAVVVPQSVAAGTDMVEVVCRMADGGDKMLKYVVPTGGLTLTSGQKTTLSLSSAVELGFTSTVSFVNGEPKIDIPLSVKAPAGSNWTLSSNQTWLKLSLATGGSYTSTITGDNSGINGNVYLSVAENSGALSAPRTATLTLSNDRGNKATYVVMQNYTAFTPPTSTVTFSAGSNQSQAIAPFVTNQMWSATPSDVTGAIGLKLATSATIGSGVLTAPYEGAGTLVANTLFMQIPTPNNTDAVKSSKVTFSIKGDSKTNILNVSQSAPVIGNFTNNLAGYNGTAAAWNSAAMTVTPQSGLQWKMTSDAGVTVSHTGIQTTAQSNVTASVPANNTDAARTYAFYLNYGSLNGTLKTPYYITQAAPVIGDFANNLYGCNTNAAAWGSGNMSVTPAAGLQWSMTADGGAGVSHTTAQTTAQGNITAWVSANNTNAARTLYYYLNYGALSGGRRTAYALTQAAPALNNGISTDLYSYSGATAAAWGSGNRTVNSGSGLQWKITPDGGVTATHTGAQGASANNVNISVPANNTASARTLYYYLDYGALNGGLRTQYSIYQPAPNVYLNSYAQSVASNATSATFYVQTNSNQYGVNYNIVPDGNVTGITPNGWQTIYTGDNYTQAVTVYFAANTASALRYIQVWVGYGVGTHTHTITQEAAGPNWSKWATGNLVANGPNSCKIGTPEDIGLYFSFGSLLGSPDGSTAITTAIAVKPAAYSGTTWPGGYTSSGEIGADNPAAGTGDPCRYYLGSAYRLPTQAELQALIDAGVTRSGNWITADNPGYAIFGGILKMRAAGYRYNAGGYITGINQTGFYGSSTTLNNDNGQIMYLAYNYAGVSSNPRGYGYSVRCLKN